MPLTRREAIAGVAGFLEILAAAPAGAQAAYPARPITLVVPFAAGGATDLLARMVAERLKSGLGAAVVVENRPGAASTVGAAYVAKAPPDGYTLLMATSTTLAISKTLYKRLPYDPVADFTPITLVAAVPFSLVVNPAMPVSSLRELIAYAKSRPGELSYASSGNGSPHHLGAEMLKTAAGLDIKHVTYRGSAPAIQDVIGGHVPLMMVDLQPALPHIRDGRLRVLGVTTASRVAAAPDIPTLAEAGLPGFELVAWQGVVAPARVPRPIVDRLAHEIAALVAAPETRTKLVGIALEPLPGSTPDSFADFVKSEVRRWAPIVKASGAVLE